MVKKKINSKTRKQPTVVMVSALVLGIAGLLYFFKSQFIIAWVNGSPVSRTAYVRELEKLAKNQALDSLTTKKLIANEANKTKTTVSQQEIDEAISNIDAKAKEQGTSLEELLVAQGVSESMVREEVRLQKLLEKMVTVDEPTDEEINQYLEQNQAYYPDQKKEDIQQEIIEQVKQQKMINAIQELIARLQTEAKIVNWL